MWLVKRLGSIWFTVWFTAGLMILLVISTSLEGLYGTAFAQTTFYQTRWFDLLLSLLWVNIFCATVIRYPFRRRHAGFLITHIGILGLLMGALMARLWGVEGKLLIGEGERSDQLRLDGYEMVVTRPGGEKTTIELTRGRPNLDLNIPGVDATLRVFDRAVETAEVVASSNPAVDNLAAKVSIRSPKMKVAQTFWLVEDHPFNPQAGRHQLGPLAVELQRGAPPDPLQQPLLQLRNAAGDILVSLPVSEEMGPGVAAVGETGWSINELRYYPFARVEDGGLTNVPDAGPNPAVTFDLAGPGGESRYVILFALFPEFATMHGRDDAPLPFTTEFSAPAPAAGVQIFADANGGWLTRFDEGGGPVDRPVMVNEWIELGKMDLQMRVEEVYDNAEVRTLITNAPDGGEGVFMAKLDIREGDARHEQWLGSGQKAGYHSAQGDIAFWLRPREYVLPFAVKLADFRKTVYPGTTNAASYESDVVVHDVESGETIERTISMNNPFDYRGFRIFQSSFIQDPRKGEASVFTVARNPGITFIYLSSTIIFLGAFIQFYVKPRPAAGGPHYA